jgi:alkanesulfonate monooxygenase SsuD/methylene tetrahydromethanopterin reductase-like flavin-dependent oxidoreductase (luciferase family)
VRYGFVLPGGTAVEQLDQAIQAEAAGWDGIFAWEAAYGVDPWTLLASIAQRTSQVRLGTMLTPLPWRRPWKLASQVATLDQLSNGRAILAVGLGATDAELGESGEEKDRRVRAERLDEGIDLEAGLWQGQLRYAGRHYTIDLAIRSDFSVAARPVQARIPIWVVAAWPRSKSMQRALRCDGLLASAMDDNGFRELVPDDICAMRVWLDEHGGTQPGFDVITEGETPADDPAAATAKVAPWAAAGCTWWLETRWALPDDADEARRQVRARIAAGPPRPV